MAVGWLGNFLWWGLEGDEVNIERNFLTHLFSATNSQRVFEVARGSHVLLFPPRRRIDIYFVMWALGFVDCCFFCSLDKSFGMDLHIVSCFGVSSATYIDN